MPMKPEAKAKQKAQQEARWAKDRGEAAPITGAEYAMEPGKAKPIITPTPAPKPKKAATKKK